MCDEFGYQSKLYKEAKALLKNIQKAKVRNPGTSVIESMYVAAITVASFICLFVLIVLMV